MSLDAVKILGIFITKNSKKQILEFLQKSLDLDGKKSGKTSQKSSKIISIVTPNPEQIVYASRHPHFADLLNRADVAIPDGGGIVWASHVLGQTVSTESGAEGLSVIHGVEFMEELVSRAAKRGVPVALIGSWGGLAVKAFDCLSTLHPGLQGWAIEGPNVEVHGSQLIVHSQEKNEEEYFNKLAQRIISSAVGMVFVGLGAPKQEYFIEKLSDALSFRPSSRNPKRIPGQARDDKTIVLMAVGGSFDVLSGHVKRAPLFFRRLRVPFFMGKIGSEWVWRLVTEPWRIKRQLALLQFVWMVLREKLL